VRLPATLVFDHPTPAVLALHLYEALVPPGAAAAERATEPATPAGDAAADLIAGMDVESLVARALSGSAT
jgi:hypothetical protein